MRISIWQQFSSNNSTSFTVIGEFQTVAEARHAARELERLLIEIAKFYEQPENAHIRRKIGPPRPLDTPLTPIELEYSQKYQIDWGYPIDWSIDSDVASEGVYNSENFVFVENGYPLRDSWMSGRPIDDLMEKLGAKIWSDRDEWKVVLNCVAPDTTDPQQFFLPDNDPEMILGLQSRFKMGNQYIWLERLAIEGKNITCRLNAAPYSLKEMVHYLSERGCTDFRYEFTRTPNV